MKNKNKDGRMIWSGKTGTDNLNTKSLRGSAGVMLILAVILTLVVTTTVYASPEDPSSTDGYIWGESCISYEVGTEEYAWGEFVDCDGDPWMEYGYAWGE
jgi:hypothetical protein